MSPKDTGGAEVGSPSERMSWGVLPEASWPGDAGTQFTSPSTGSVIQGGTLSEPLQGRWGRLIQFLGQNMASFAGHSPGVGPEPGPPPHNQGALYLCLALEG